MFKWQLNTELRKAHYSFKNVSILLMYTKQNLSKGSDNANFFFQNRD